MTVYNYPVSEFTSLVGDMGRRVLATAVAAAIPGVALRPGRLGFRFIDDDGVGDPRFQFNFDGTLSGAQETLLDGIVAAHAGQVAPVAADVVGSIYYHHHRWDANSTTRRYLPWKGEAEGTSPTADDVSHFLPGAFLLLEITVFTTGANIAGSTDWGLHIDGDGSPVAEVTKNMQQKDAQYLIDFRNTTNAVAWNQLVALSCDPTGDPEDFVATSVWQRTG